MFAGAQYIEQTQLRAKVLLGNTGLGRQILLQDQRVDIYLLK